ncbi:MAG TPA: nucleotidyltransferase family protein [Pirellulales bacterium]|jgi:NDP-sugar pyrophosphorylase family protein|nr:nucleotidyltransferase family protein [Pirellulales bacterium]
MKALLLTAGFGTRLGDLTREVPKPLLDVVGRPMVEYIVRHLVDCGCRRLAMNLHFKPQAFRQHFGGGRDYGLRIDYSHESELLGTAGGARKLIDHVGRDSAVLVHYGDVVTNHNHAALLRFHREHDALATMLVHERQRSNSVVERDDEGRVLRFWERPSETQHNQLTSCWVNSGVCVLEPEVFDWIVSDAPSDLPSDLFPRLVETGRLFSMPLDGYRVAVDSADRLSVLRRDVASGACTFNWQRGLVTTKAA